MNEENPFSENSGKEFKKLSEGQHLVKLAAIKLKDKTNEEGNPYKGSIWIFEDSSGASATYYASISMGKAGKLYSWMKMVLGKTVPEEIRKDRVKYWNLIQQQIGKTFSALVEVNGEYSNVISAMPSSEAMPATAPKIEEPKTVDFDDIPF